MLNPAIIILFQLFKYFNGCIKIHKNNKLFKKSEIIKVCRYLAAESDLIFF